jgi:hypothetical protein
MLFLSYFPSSSFALYLIVPPSFLFLLLLFAFSRFSFLIVCSFFLYASLIFLVSFPSHIFISNCFFTSTLKNSRIQIKTCVCVFCVSVLSRMCLPADRSGKCIDYKLFFRHSIPLTLIFLPDATFTWDLRISRRRGWRCWSSGLWRRVDS